MSRTSDISLNHTHSASTISEATKSNIEHHTSINIPPRKDPIIPPPHHVNPPPHVNPPHQTGYKPKHPSGYISGRTAVPMVNAEDDDSCSMQWLMDGKFPVCN